jgi:hypothetical protein
MTWERALDLVVARTGHSRYRVLCAEDNPDVAQRDAYRRLVVSEATGGPSPPSVATMATSAIRAGAGFVASGFATVDRAEQERRLAICGACPDFDAGPGRCRLCSCYMGLKSRIAGAKCPIDKW